MKCDVTARKTCSPSNNSEHERTSAITACLLRVVLLKKNGASTLLPARSLLLPSGRSTSGAPLPGSMASTNGRMVLRSDGLSASARLPACNHGCVRQNLSRPLQSRGLLYRTSLVAGQTSDAFRMDVSVHHDPSIQYSHGALRSGKMGRRLYSNFLSLRARRFRHRFRLVSLMETKVHGSASNSNMSEESFNTTEFDCGPGSSCGRNNFMGRIPNRSKLLRRLFASTEAAICSACRKEESYLCKRRNYNRRTLQTGTHDITAVADCNNDKQRQIAS